MARKEQDRGRQQSKSRAASRPGAAKAATAPTASATPAPVARGKSKEGGGVIIANCTCVSEFQDSRYGEHKRVFNHGANGSCCTVCGAKKSV